MRHNIHLEQRIGRCLLDDRYSKEPTRTAGIATLTIDTVEGLLDCKSLVQVGVSTLVHQPDYVTNQRFLLNPNIVDISIVTRIAQRIATDRMNDTDPYSGSSVDDPHCITDEAYVADIAKLLMMDPWNRFSFGEIPVEKGIMYQGRVCSAIRILGHNTVIPFPWRQAPPKIEYLGDTK